MHFGDKKILIFLLIILAIATFFRLWQLDQIPPWLYPDVAMNGNDALQSLKSNDFKLFYLENNGREGLMIWLIALSFWIFGVSVWSIKIVAAIIGILTVLGLYLLTKELLSNYYEAGSRRMNLKNEAIALLASFFLAISFWHVNFSRLGFRAILLPFILVFAFYFLFKGFGQKKLFHLIIAGVFFGFGFYTYISYRFIVLLLIIVLLGWFLIYRKQFLNKKFIFFASFFLFSIFIVALPIGIYFLKNQQDFVGRASPISIFAAENPLKEFGKSLILHLGMFNLYGDPNWRHNFATSPQLFWPMGILFLFGVVISIKNLISSIKNRNVSLFAVYCLLLCWVIIFLLPGILTYEGIPHALRTIGVIPPVFILTALGACKIYEFLEQNVKNKKLLIFISFFFLLSLSFFEYNKYFNLWAENKKLKEAFTENYAEIGYFLNSLPGNVKKYVIIDTPNNPVFGISIDAQTPIFIESTEFGAPRATYLRFEEVDEIYDFRNKVIFIPLYEDGILQQLMNKFPWGQIKTKGDFKYYELY